MSSLIKFEIEKIFKRKITMVAILALVAFNAMLYMNWGAPSIQVMKDGGGYASGVEAVELDKQICAKYEGTITGDTVNQIIEDHRDKAIATDVLANMDSAYDNIGMEFLYDYELPITDEDVESKYGDDSNRQFYYGFGWTRLVKYLSLLFISLGFVLVIALSPSFSEEYQRGTDALIMTAKYGRQKSSLAKVAVGLILAIILSVIIMGINFLMFTSTYGLDGWNMSVNIDPELAGTAEGMKIGTVAINMAIMWFFSMIGTASLVLICSVLCKTPFMSLLISLVAFIGPCALLKINKLWAYYIGALCPANQSITGVVLSVPDVNIGSLSISYTWFAVGAMIVLTVAGAVVCSRVSEKHQVM